MMQNTSVLTMITFLSLQKIKAFGDQTASREMQNNLIIIKTQMMTFVAFGIPQLIPVQNQLMNDQTFTTQ